MTSLRKAVYDNFDFKNGLNLFEVRKLDEEFVPGSGGMSCSWCIDHNNPRTWQHLGDDLYGKIYANDVGIFLFSMVHVFR